MTLWRSKASRPGSGWLVLVRAGVRSQGAKPPGHPAVWMSRAVGTTNSASYKVALSLNPPRK
jgi:hypothetical protein